MTIPFSSTLYCGGSTGWRIFAGAFGVLVLGFLTSVLGAATILDLHSPSGTHGQIVTAGGAYFEDIHEGHTQSNVFLELTSNDPSIQGINGDFSAGNVPYPEIDHSKTRKIALSEVPLAFGFRVFLLDSNQTQSGPDYDHIDIEQLKVWTVPNSTTILTLSDLNSHPMAYDLDIGIDYTLRAEGKQGSGKSDMHLFIPDSAFTRHGDETQTSVYFYTQMTNNSDGFEHLSVDDTFTYSNPVPEPSSALLFGLALVGTFLRRQR